MLIGEGSMQFSVVGFYGSNGPRKDLWVDGVQVSGLVH